MNNRLRHSKSHCLSLILNDSHTVSVSCVATGEDDSCDFPHLTNSTAAIVVIRRCFIGLVKAKQQ
jgi:hypothetical protein